MNIVDLALVGLVAFVGINAVLRYLDSIPCPLVVTRFDVSPWDTRAVAIEPIDPGERGGSRGPGNRSVWCSRPRASV